MKNLVLLLLIFAACDDTVLVRVECPVGRDRECHWEENSTQIALGVCRMGVQKCTVAGWGECKGAVGPSEEVCDGQDNNCNGLIDEVFPQNQQLCGFVEGANYGEGVCTPGILVCNSGYLECSGHIGPSEEICDGKDNNCNGNIDEGIANQTAVVCYDGPENTLNVGQCRAGIKYCVAGDMDGICEGQILPSPERCDQIDNNCNGRVDEGLQEMGVDIVFVLDISGSFDDEIVSMIEGIAPLLDDPIAARMRFGLVVIGLREDNHNLPPSQRYSMRLTDFVPADEFLHFLESARLLDSGGREPSLDALLWTMNGRYSFSWEITNQHVIILMTDEEAQTMASTNAIQVRDLANDLGFEIYIFALPEHHSVFLRIVNEAANRMFTPQADSATVFRQIRSIFNDLCIEIP